MRFECPACDLELTRLWRDALQDVVIRHHDPVVDVVLVLGETDLGTELRVEVRNCIDTAQRKVVRLASLVVSTTRLTYFPGVTSARRWLACAWAGYIQHETLELVTVGGEPTERVIDPHRPCDVAAEHRLAPYPHDRGLRDGFPVELTPATLLLTLETAMDCSVAIG